MNLVDFDQQTYKYMESEEVIKVAQFLTGKFLATDRHADRQTPILFPWCY